MQKERYKDFQEKKEQIPSEDFEININENEPKPPLRYKERFLLNNTKYEEMNEPSIRNKNVSKVQSPESFWNVCDDEYFKVENSVLIKELSDETLSKKWDDNINSYLANNSHISKSIRIDNVSDGKLYKLFQYNTDKKQWELNSSEKSKILNDKKIFNDENNPIIFYINSLEKDLIEINSFINNTSFQELDNNSICVYATFNYHVYDVYHYRRPFFLQLHIPNDYEKLISKEDNIKTIIYKIYCFLLIISDINVIVLNKSFYQEQIDLIKTLNYLKWTFIYMYKDIKSIDQEDYSSDDDCEDYSILKDDRVNIKTINDFSVIQNRQFKNIILINDKAINSCKIIKDEFIKINIEDIDFKINYINVHDKNTYYVFMSSIIDLTEDIDTNFKQAFEKFNYISLTETGTTFINLRLKKNWESNLETLINNRFNQFKQINNSKYSELFILSQVEKELSNFKILFDEVFLNKYNSIITEIRNRINQKNNDYIKNELSNSSEIYVKYLETVINMKLFLFDDKNDII